MTSCQESPSATSALYATFGASSSDSFPAETTVGAMGTAPSTAISLLAAPRNGVGDILFKAVLYFGLLLLILVLSL